MPVCCTQCAAVSTSFGAIKAPVQELPREPTMVTTERPMPSADGTPPPTIAQAGAERSNAETAIVGARIFTGAAIARNLLIAKGWCRPAHRVSRYQIIALALAGN